MDELITILIIVGAIISFLSKIFRQQKEAQKESTQAPVAKPKPKEWQPSWFEDIESESEFSLFEEKEIPVTETAGKPVKENLLKKDVKNFEPVVSDNKDEVAVDKEFGASPELKEIFFSLKTPNDIRKGIVLAEILGPCKANKIRITY